MIKDITEKNNNVTLGAKEVEVLRENFPACFHADGSFDIERFKEYLKDKINVTDEGYELRFLGKNYARLLASLDTTTVVVPDEKHNSMPENKDSKNVYISGDNIDALKHLLKSYAGRIKCIYIDPPYNTGSDGFVYNDSFKFTPEELSSKLSISEEQAIRILDLTRRGSATHSAWLMFMLPRLVLARDLLSDDGVIFISIDDNEQSNLKLLCDDVFGEENFLGNIVRSTGQTTGQDSGGLGSSFDYILVYSRKEGYELNGLELSEKDKKRFQDKDDVGFYAYDQLRKTGSNDKREDRPNLYYGIKNPDGEILYPSATAGYDSRWRVEKTSYENLVKNNMILWKKTMRNNEEVWWPYVKYYLDGRTKRPSPLWNDLEGNKKAAREVRDLFDGKKVFDFPKPIDLLNRIITIATEKDSIIVDFFGGSSTTAHALMKKNSEDGGDRTFILVQLQELCEKDSEAFKCGFRTIDEIGMERIKRAANKIKQENPLFHGDLGFRHYTLQEPSDIAVEKIENYDPKYIFGDKTLVDEFGVPAIIATWLVRDGYGLTPEIETLDFDGYEVYCMPNHLYIINPGLTNEAVGGLLDKYQTEAEFNPQNIVVYGYALSWNEQQGLKDNMQTVQAGEKNMRINFDIRY
ncbi:putative methyltransferase [uncultured Bacteroides sp.]|uniref:site-specific DNA-methyltransferase n=1 Tax=Bacteroides cellulolyticus TaxID=2981780 RepID=UPI0008213021|nr:site-specific DNA-methyltransferase [Bacteroides cellulolyticus]MCU6771732.1 site-specific DNA-methyltransferase [Bacteroides cellulolyticus]SCI01502.1 putative methyltransferase [uncultured Bacteroides sp.]